MLFTSLEYILFLPLIVALYFVLQNRFRWILLLGASYFFYAYWRFDFLALVIVSTLVDYYAGLQMAKYTEKRKRKKLLYLSLFVNLGLLFVFKYLGFFNEEVRQLLKLFDTPYSVPEFDILLPIGISFYTFQTLSYTLDVYKGIREPERHLGYFALYVAFFPQLVAGPIERSTRLIPQLRKHVTFHWNNISAGSRLIIWGMFKKVIVADYLILYIKPIFDNPDAYPGEMLVAATFLASVWVYADFSGYTDIAIGSARLFGIRLMPNFKRPYFSQSISEFWQRWHISLTTWVNDYMFRPLVRKSTAKYGTYGIIILVFMTIGFWHGASWNFLLFGFIHGAYIISNRMTRKLRKPLMDKLFERTSSIRIGINILVTFLFWQITSIPFISSNLEDARYMFTHLLSWGNPITIFDISGLYLAHYTVMFIGLFILLLAETINIKELENPIDNFRFSGVRWSFYLGLLFLLIVFDGQGNEFVYFQF